MDKPRPAHRVPAAQQKIAWLEPGDHTFTPRPVGKHRAASPLDWFPASTINRTLNTERTTS